MRHTSQIITPDEKYSNVKMKAILLSMLLEDMAADPRISAAQRSEFTKAMDLIDAALDILRKQGE